MERIIDHAETFQILKNRGYPLAAIRRVMPILVGIAIKDMALLLGTNRQNVTNHIGMVPYRHTREIQKGISTLLRIPEEIFFEKEGSHDHAR